MEPHELAESLSGVAFATITPFTEDRTSVHHGHLESNLEVIDDAGGRLYLPCGNSGEYFALSPDERVDVVETHVDTVGDDGVVIAGVSGSTKEAKEHIARYEEVGADGIMVMPPAHTYKHERGFVEYYEALADATDLGLVIYKIGDEVTDRVVEDLSTRDDIVGVKYATGDAAEFSSLISSVPGEYVWVNGSAERYAPSYALEGAVGYTTGIGNFAPEATLTLMEAIRNENWAEAKRLRNCMQGFEELRQEAGPDNTLPGAANIPAVKYGMELAGLHGGPVREPLVDLSAEEKERARAAYERIQSITESTQETLSEAK